MPFVLTVDQKASRRGPDQVGDVLATLNATVPAVLSFERTAGDEFQGVLEEPDAVVDVVLQLVRLGNWSIGVGAGPVQTPLPDSTRAATGTAFLCARRAVDAAKQRPVRLAVRGAVPALLGFERTAGDEFQGVLADPRDAVAVVLDLVREGGWSIGVGAGPVQTPLPESTRAGAGAAFVWARRAVEAAKSRPARVAVRGAVDDDATDAQAVLTALAVLLQRRSPAAWEAVALVEAGRTQAEAAAQLGITRQAVGQRLAAGAWELERDLRPTAARLLARAAG